MEQAVEERGDGRGVAEELAPVVDGAVRREDRGGALVASHDELEEVLGGGVGQLAHAEVVDDEQGDAGQLGEVGLAGVGEGGLGELFEEGVGFAVEDAVALLDGSAADGLRDVTFPRTGGNRPILPIIRVLKRRFTMDSIHEAVSAWRSCGASSFVGGG